MNALRPQAQRLPRSPATFYKQCRASLHETRRNQSRRSNTVLCASQDVHTSTQLPTPQIRRSLYGETSCLPQHRSFSTSIARAATHVLQNPRKDDEGNDMIIDISPQAATRLQQITANPAPSSPLSSPSTSASQQHQQHQPQSTHLRITVTSGGCHGFQYLMSLEPSSKISTDDDTVFSVAGMPTAQVVLDESSLELLKGSTVDYTTELIGSQFKIVGNPRAKSSCGCGTSFDID